AQQLEAVRGQAMELPPSSVALPAAPLKGPTPSPPVTASSDKREVYVPYQAITPGLAVVFEGQKQRHLEALVERFTRRTSGSKQLMQTCRPYLADNRASAGFRLSVKEMVYPIVAKRSQGSRVWDIDGNEYIDL